MGKQQDFPITIRAGATAIKIYRSPLLVPDVDPNSEKKAYDSFLVAYYRGGKRHRIRCKSIDLAQAQAQRIQTSILNEDLHALQLTGRDQVEYCRAKECLRPYSMALDSAVREYVEAKAILGETSVAEAVRFFERFGRTVTESKAIPVIVKELIEDLRGNKVSSYHLRDMEKRLSMFAATFSSKITEVKAKDISVWLRGLKTEDKKGNPADLAPKTKNHYRNAVVQLFNFARDQGYLPKGLPTEAEGLKAAKVTPSENKIFTVEQMRTLLRKASTPLVPVMALKAFSGIRTEELVKLQWEHIHWESKHIRLPATVTKTTQRRIIPISDNLVQWLSPHKKKSGRVAQRWKTPQTLVQAFDRHGKANRIDVGANRFRNSYISYRVALTKDVQRVSLESGNSPRVIQRDYLELATDADAKRWFEIRPSLEQLEANSTKLIEHSAKEIAADSAIPSAPLPNQVK